MARHRPDLSHQALDWLRADLAAHGNQPETGSPAELATVQKTMRHWQKSP